MQEAFESFIIMLTITWEILSHSFLHPFSITMGLFAFGFGIFIFPKLSQYFDSEAQNAYKQGLHDASMRKNPVHPLTFHSTVEKESYLAGYNQSSKNIKEL